MENTRTPELARVLAAIESLDPHDQYMYFSALFGLVKLDSPKSILDAAKWCSVRDKIQKHLDDNA